MSFRITTEIVNGECPSCEQQSLLVNVGFSSYRCIQCGENLEQKILLKAISYLRKCVLLVCCSLNLRLLDI